MHELRSGHPADDGDRRRRGVAQQLARRRLEGGDQRRVPLPGGPQHHVVGATGLHQHPPGSPPFHHGRFRHRPRRQRQQAQRVLGGPVPDREQLLVDVEERHETCPVGPVQHGARTDQRPTADIGRRRRGDQADGLPQQRLELLTGPGDTGAQQRQGGGAAREAHLWTPRPAAGALQVEAVAQVHRGVAALAGGDRPAAAAREQTGTAGPVEHADDTAAGAEHVTGHLDEGRREQTAASHVLVPTVDHHQGRPPVAGRPGAE